MFRKGYCGRLLAVMGSTILVAGCLGIDDQDPVTVTVSKLRYFEIVPPSELHFPGSISSVEVMSHGQIVLHPTCEVDQKEIMAVARKSRVPQSQWSRIEEVSLSIRGFIEDLIGAGGEGGEKKDVSIEIRNPEILVISDAKLREIKIAALEKKSCENAVRELVKNGTTVCQIRAALKGDLEYTIVHSEDFSIDIEGQAKPGTSADFSVDDGVTGSSQTSGEDMIFAVRLSEDGLFFNDQVSHGEDISPELFKVPKCPQL